MQRCSCRPSVRPSVDSDNIGVKAFEFFPSKRRGGENLITCQIIGSITMSIVACCLPLLLYTIFQNFQYQSVFVGHQSVSFTALYFSFHLAFQCKTLSETLSLLFRNFYLLLLSFSCLHLNSFFWVSATPLGLAK